MIVRSNPQRIHSVQRAAAILRAFSHTAPELGVSEIGRQLKLHKSTVSRLLATLEGEGLVERVAQNDKYRLGREVARLAAHAPHLAEVGDVARPFLESLATYTGETINLALLDSDEVLNVAQASGPHLVGGSNWVGRRTPFHCVANGKALLAFQPRDVIEHALSKPLLRFTPRTMTSKAALRAELARVRANGYATARGELEEGLNAVAAPIWNARAEVVAALSVSGPAYRVKPARFRSLGALTARAAEQITARLADGPFA